MQGNSVSKVKNLAEGSQKIAEIRGRAVMIKRVEEPKNEIVYLRSMKMKVTMMIFT